MPPRTGSFLDEIALGRYVPGESPLHHCRTGWKALVFTLVAAATFQLQSSASFLFLGLVLAALATRSGLPQSLFWRSLRPVNLLAFFTILAGAFLNHANAPHFSWDGLHQGGLFAGRLVFITLLTTLFFLTTRPKAAIHLGIVVLKPLRLLGIEQNELSLLVHLAYRFVPLLRREIEELALGQRARNLPPPSNFFQKMKFALDAVVFVFVGAMRRAETTGLALEQRRVVQSWSGAAPEDVPGWGGWMVLVLLLTTGLSLWKDAVFL